MNHLIPLMLGLAGSLHCVGMCGPLLLALPLDATAKWLVLRRMLLYHSGRILTYTALGLLFGLAGKGLALAGFQKILSLAAGFLMLATALMAWRFERLVTSLPGFAAFSKKVKSGMHRLLSQHTVAATFSLGMLNGLLPCGMVYAALAGAIAQSEGAAGSLFMLLFGLGTLPLLLIATVAGRTFNGFIRQKIRIAQPVLMLLASLLLLQRGLHLDLSLFESALPKAGFDCH